MRRGTNDALHVVEYRIHAIFIECLRTVTVVVLSSPNGRLREINICSNASDIRHVLRSDVHAGRCINPDGVEAVTYRAIDYYSGVVGQIHWGSDVEPWRFEIWDLIGAGSIVGSTVRPVLFVHGAIYGSSVRLGHILLSRTCFQDRESSASGKGN